MGYGDELMASGFAKGAKARGQRIAFGDGQKIRWHPYAKEIFRGNPNVAPPGDESATDLHWVANYAGKRPYNRQVGYDHWQWIPGHSNRPGEVFFSDEELEFASKAGSDFVVVEPNVPAFKKVAPNKQWPFRRYQRVADALGREVVQFRYGPPHGPGFNLERSRKIVPPSFRHAMAVLARAALFVGSEGGMHHAAAAVGVPAVVIFGGFVSPKVTGYDAHANMFIGDDLGCGKLSACVHCQTCMNAISSTAVLNAAKRLLVEERIAASA